MRRIINFCVLVITILTVNLLTGFITGYFLHYKRAINPLKFTALGMIILVAIFYPVFGYIETKTEEIARKLLKKGKHTFGKRFGFIIVFSLIIFLLYSIYAKMWFGINVPETFLEMLF
jgi:hypothetical protein